MTRMGCWQGMILASMLLAVAGGAFATEFTPPVSADKSPATPQEFETPDQDVAALSMTPPEYPKDEAWRGISGDVALVITVDAEGMPEQFEMEKSSGIAGLDLTALEAARDWRFAPARLKGRAIRARVRVPIKFEIPPAYALHRVTGRPRDAHFEARRKGLEAVPLLDANGLVPGLVPDLYPIGVETVEAAKELLDRYAYRETDVVPDVVYQYTLRDEEGMSEWDIASPPQFPAAVVRRRLVGNAEGSWFVTSLLCEAEQTACEKLEGFLRSSMPAQQKLPPLPILPPLKTDA